MNALNAAILLLMIFNAGGIRLVDNYIVSIVIMLLLFLKLQVTQKIDRRFLLVTSFLVLVFLSINYVVTSFGSYSSKYFFYFSYIFPALMLVAFYRVRHDDFASDLVAALKVFMYHALLGFIVQFLVEPSGDISGTHVRHIAYIFFYAFRDTVELFHRNCGLFWEPGVLQVFMNILLFLTLFVRKSKINAVLAVVIILSTVSTTGFVIMAVQLAYYFLSATRLRTLFLLPVYVCISVGVFWLAMVNIQEKISDKSAGVRMFDLVVGLEIAKEHPFIGIGLNSSVLAEQSEGVGELYQKVYHISDEELEDKGTTNGVLYMVISLGIPMSALFFFLLYMQNILPKQLLFFFILLASGLSEPVVQTGFFGIFLAFGLSRYYPRRGGRLSQPCQIPASRINTGWGREVLRSGPQGNQDWRDRNLREIEGSADGS